MSAGTTDVIVLPNNGNVILTANQAKDADTGEVTLHVLATRTMPQGTGALLGFNPEVSLADNLANMEAASGAVETLEVTQAVRDSVVDGREVREGEYMAILDGKLAALAETADTAVREGLQYSAADENSVITLYWGEGASAETAAALQEELEESYGGTEVDAYEGGQPHYPYLVSVE